MSTFELDHSETFTLENDGDNSYMEMQYDNYEDDDFDDNQLREAFQIDVGKGDAIPGVSPHIGGIGIGYSPVEKWIINLDVEANSAQFYRGDENNSAGQKVPGYFLLNLSTEYALENKIDGVESIFFLEARNILDENYETGGIYAENEVSGTGGSGTFVTPGQPFSIFGGVNLNW